MAQNLEIAAVDDFPFSSLLENRHDSETVTERTDAEIAEELQLQEALVLSMVATSGFNVNNMMIATPSSSSWTVVVKEPDEKPDSDLEMVSEEAEKPETDHEMESKEPEKPDKDHEMESKEPEKPDKDHEMESLEIRARSRATEIVETTVMEETSEEGQSSLSFCEICVERTQSEHMFRTQSCLHSYCCDCLTKHVVTRLQEPNQRNMVRCPGENCKEALELETCRPILPKAVIDRWEQALCEAMICEEQVFYCPFKDCSGMLVNDIGGEEAIRESECPFCHRLFCAQCYVPWHPGVDCEQFRSLNEDERERDALMVMELAKSQKWKRCPKCRFFVERTDGCLHMTCRCNFEFCYGCGSQWTANHNGCTANNQ